MVQFTDIHFGEWEENDQKSYELMKNVIKWEKPDLVVVTGDAVSGYAWNGTQGWYAHHYHKFVQAMVDMNQSWAFTAGNHDSQADLTREQISELDRSFNLSLTKPNSGNLTHAFNYMLPIYDKIEEDVVYRLWFLDSGDEGCLGEIKGYDCVRPDQIEWFTDENTKIPVEDLSKGEGFLFVHIPLYEYMHLINSHSFFGTLGENVCCQAVNTGLFKAIKQQKSINWISVGHDHNNDYMGDYEGINLAYGRKTGYSCYGPKNLKHGARVFEVSYTEENNSTSHTHNRKYSVKTWIREEDKNKVVQNNEQTRSFFKPVQQFCGGAVSKAEVIEFHEEEQIYLRQYYQNRDDLRHLLHESYQ
eukprot:403375407